MFVHNNNNSCVKLLTIIYEWVLGTFHIRIVLDSSLWHDKRFWFIIVMVATYNNYNTKAKE